MDARIKLPNKARSIIKHCLEYCRDPEMTEVRLRDMRREGTLSSDQYCVGLWFVREFYKEQIARLARLIICQGESP